jgi:hypothetical protein
MEAPEGPQTAENIAAYFAKTSTKASAHVCVDNDSEVRCVSDADTAWAAPRANATACSSSSRSTPGRARPSGTTSTRARCSGAPRCSAPRGLPPTASRSGGSASPS